MNSRSRHRLPLPHKSRNIRLARQENGQFQIAHYNAWYTYWRDPYHFMLTIPWWGFAGLVSLAYVLINSIFGLLYFLGGDCLMGARPGSFEDCFFFSVHTLGSIGYGVIAPKTTYANIIVTLEAITSLLAIAVVTGLAFARFSKPTARVTFSNYAVITVHDGLPMLMFRVANQRRNQILDTQIRLFLMRDEQTHEGETVYRIHDLTLVRDRSPGLMLTWTIMHPLTPDSPLHGTTATDLIESHAQLRISLTGVDETVAYTVTTRHNYGAEQILFDHRLKDIIYLAPDGDRYFNHQDFHEVLPLGASSN
jgi:inward rectifier potassium channel